MMVNIVSDALRQSLPFMSIRTDVGHGRTLWYFGKEILQDLVRIECRTALDLAVTFLCF